MITKEMFRGDDELYEIEVTDEETGEAVDITGCTIKLYWYAPGTDTEFKNWTFTLTNPVNGLAEVAIPSADTNGLPFARHEFDFKVKITKTDLTTETLANGKFIVEA